MNYIRVFSSFLIVMLFMSYNCAAVEYDRDFIQSLVKKYLQEHISPPANGKIAIKVATIDPRVTIKPCQTPLQVNIPEKYSGRNVNVKISCSDSTPWKLFLPAKIMTTLPVLIASKNITKGSVLTTDNTKVAFIDSKKIRGERLTDQSTVLGAKAERRIGKGRAISKRSICIVCKGDIVTITAKADNLHIKTQGVAISSGNINDQIRVKNSSSGKVINPKVKAMNQVIINL